METTPWPDTKLAQYGARCSSRRRDEEFPAAVMIAAADATITKETARRAAIEALDNNPDCEHLVIVGYDFEAGIAPAVQTVNVHKVIASKDLQLPETLKHYGDGGTFTLLAEIDCAITQNNDGEPDHRAARLRRVQPYHRPGPRLRHGGGGLLDDRHQPRRAVIPRPAHPFPRSGCTTTAVSSNLMKSLKKELDPHAEQHVMSMESQPFPPPATGRNIAVKVITTTGAEMTTTIDDDW